MDYTHFTVKDFARDPYFQKWVLTSDVAAEQFWQSWLKQHPHKEREVAEAREIILLLGFQQDYTANEDFLEVWEEVQARVSHTPVRVSKTAFLQPLTRVAAVFAGIMIAAVVLLLLWKTDPTVTYATQYGETRSVTLPDGSTAVLNANSSIHFPESWEPGEPREVWMEGEVFFEVQKIVAEAGNMAANNEEAIPVKFIVHTGSVDVEVLGTQFNVNNRHKETRVVLKSGQVRLRVKDSATVEELFMQPGEMVAFNEVSRELTKKVVNPDIHASWKDHQLIFEEASLGEIAQTLKDIYGIAVVFEDPELATSQFTGLVPSDDIDVLLEAFTKLYNIRMTKSQDTIIFHKE